MEYSNEKLIYHIRYCIDSDLLRTDHEYFGSEIWITDLTPEGHEFLANIRKDSVWQSTKDIAAKVGSTSLGSLTQIACSVVTELIKSHFGLT